MILVDGEKTLGEARAEHGMSHSEVSHRTSIKVQRLVILEERPCLASNSEIRRLQSIFGPLQWPDRPDQERLRRMHLINAERQVQGRRLVEDQIQEARLAGMTAGTFACPVCGELGTWSVAFNGHLHVHGCHFSWMQ